MKRHPSETTILRRDGRYVRRPLRQAEPDDRITPLRLIGLTLFMLWIWLALGGLVWVVMAAAS